MSFLQAPPDTTQHVPAWKSQQEPDTCIRQQSSQGFYRSYWHAPSIIAVGTTTTHLDECQQQEQVLHLISCCCAVGQTLWCVVRVCTNTKDVCVHVHVISIGTHSIHTFQLEVSAVTGHAIEASQHQAFHISTFAVRNQHCWHDNSPVSGCVPVSAACTKAVLCRLHRLQPAGGQPARHMGSSCVVSKLFTCRNIVAQLAR